MEVIVSTFFSCVLTLAVGRVILSLLPPGRPGYHELAGLPLTLATSWLLGLGGTRVAAELMPGEPHWLKIAAPWLVLGLLRWRMLPGAMVPRHPVRHERAPGWIRAVAVVLAIALIPLSIERAGALWPALNTAALLVIVTYALESARRAPLARFAVELGIIGWTAWQILVLPDREPANVLTLAYSAQTSAVLGAAAAFAVPFVRQADRRAGTLSLLLCAELVLFSTNGSSLALAGSLAIVLAAPAPMRARTAIVAAALLGVLALSMVAGGSASMLRHAIPTWPSPSLRPRLALSALAFASLTAGTALIVLRLRRSLAAASPRTIEGTDPPLSAVPPPSREGHARHGDDLAPRRETLATGLLLALCLVASLLSSQRLWSTPETSVRTLAPVYWPLVPVAILWIALVALGPERVQAR